MAFAPANLKGIEPLIVSYQQTQDPELLTDIIRRGTGLVRHLASFYAAGPCREDMEQAGYEGLIKAARNFDPARGTAFVTYATYAVRAEMRRCLDTAGIPRWAREIYARLDGAREEFFQLHGRLPSLTELSIMLNIKEESLAYLLQVRAAGGNEIEARRIVHRDYESFHLPIEDRIALTQAVARLTDLQKRVIYLLFYRQMTQQEAGQHLGLPQRRVSRLLHAGLTALRRSLTP